MARPSQTRSFARVEAVMAEGAGVTRAEAIRRVAARMDRSVSAMSSAYYAGARKAREADAGRRRRRPGRRARRAARPAADAAALYAEMLPLVEAGATVEQAARRFGDDDESRPTRSPPGFSRWILAAPRRRGDAAPRPAAHDPRRPELERALKDAEGADHRAASWQPRPASGISPAPAGHTRVRAILDSATAGVGRLVRALRGVLEARDREAAPRRRSAC